MGHVCMHAPYTLNPQMSAPVRPPKGRAAAIDHVNLISSRDRRLQHTQTLNEVACSRLSRALISLIQFGPRLFPQHKI